MRLVYAVVVEQTPNNYSAYAPDVPGCISTADTWDKILEMIREALVFHIESMLDDGEPLPEPRMSINEAIANHSASLAALDEELRAEFGEMSPTLSTRFEHVDIEVPVPQAAQAS